MIEIIIPVYTFIGLSFAFGTASEAKTFSLSDWFLNFFFWPIIVGALFACKVIRWLNK